MNLVKAKEYVAKGEKQLIKAKKDHQEARKVNYLLFKENVLYSHDRTITYIDYSFSNYK